MASERHSSHPAIALEHLVQRGNDKLHGGPLRGCISNGLLLRGVASERYEWNALGAEAFRDWLRCFTAQIEVEYRDIAAVLLD